jgi:mannan polymerase II complex MNN11 subunit
VDPSEIDIICVQDKNGLNAGSFLVRNSKIMQLFLDLWSDPILVDFANANWLLKEQDLLLHLIFQHPTLRNRIGWVPQNMLDSYASNVDGVAWQSGDLVVHFPDCSYGLLYRNANNLQKSW